MLSLRQAVRSYRDAIRRLCLDMTPDNGVVVDIETSGWYHKFARKLGRGAHVMDKGMFPVILRRCKAKEKIAP